LFLHSFFQNDLGKLRREYQVLGFNSTEGSKASSGNHNWLILQLLTVIS
jgi:hypothetical protein